MTEQKKLKVLTRGVKEASYAAPPPGGLVCNPPATVGAFVTEASNIEHALFARVNHYQRVTGVADPTPSIYDIGTSISDIRGIIRDVVREELIKRLPVA